MRLTQCTILHLSVQFHFTTLSLSTMEHLTIMSTRLLLNHRNQTSSHTPLPRWQLQRLFQRTNQLSQQRSLQRSQQRSQQRNLQRSQQRNPLRNLQRKSLRSLLRSKKKKLLRKLLSSLRSLKRKRVMFSQLSPKNQQIHLKRQHQMMINLKFKMISNRPRIQNHLIRLRSRNHKSNHRSKRNNQSLLLLRILQQKRLQKVCQPRRRTRKRLNSKSLKNIDLTIVSIKCLGLIILSLRNKHHPNHTFQDSILRSNMLREMRKRIMKTLRTTL